MGWCCTTCMMMHHSALFRERANLQLANRRLERKVKEMMMQGEEEHHSMQDQKDQVCHHTLTHTVQACHKTWCLSLSESSAFVEPCITLYVLILLIAESASKGLETADGWSRGGNRPTRAQQEEAAERPGWAGGDQWAAAEPAQDSAEWDQVNNRSKIRGDAYKKNTTGVSSNILCRPDVRAPLPRCSTRCTTMTTTTMTSALMGRRTSAHHRATSAPRVRTTSCPPSLCKQIQD